MNHNDYPILEYDASPSAVIQPDVVLKPHEKMPERVVFCFFQKAIEAACGANKAECVHHLGSEIGKNPIYRLEHQGQSVAVIHPGVGAPLAAAVLEEAIALGGRKFIAVGGAGVLDSKIGVGHVVIPTSAIRDEGTSYHYLPPSREVEADKDAVQAIIQTLDKHGIPHDLGKTWTTDAIYRETPDKVRKRREEGAITVEMEAATFFAVAQFRGVQFGQMLYGGDDLGGEAWDHRDWVNQHSTREKLFWLAVEAVLAL
jgi:uridine phosphorylase